MRRLIYACLIGNWVCLNDDPRCVIGDDAQSPIEWYNSNAEIYARNTYSGSDSGYGFPQNSFYNLEHIRLRYLEKWYDINPVFIQIVYEWPKEDPDVFPDQPKNESQ